MLFSRRQQADLWEKFRVFIWPRRSWRRSALYVNHRVRRIQASPHTIAIGFVAGVFVSWTPFMGLHFALAATIAWLLRGSLIASALGTFFGNPLTFPFIWVTSYNLGNYLLGHTGSNEGAQLGKLFDHFWAGNVGWLDFLHSFWNVAEPMLIGGTPMGILSAVLCYYPVRKAVEAYQHQRAARFAALQAGENDDKDKKLAIMA